jgi:hypothetical protein
MFTRRLSSGDHIRTTTWAAFIRIHLALLAGTDFLTGGGADAAWAGDLLRAVFHPSPGNPIFHGRYCLERNVGARRCRKRPRIRATGNERDPTVDEFLTCSGANIREGSGEAYYGPSDDLISLPSFAAFKSAAHFYGTAFHELGHWTGHESRLNRDLRLRFGDRSYAAEELVAELCAAFLCAEFSIDGDMRHAGYIQSWIGLLKHDCRAFFTACSKAQAAADYLRGLALREQPAIAA